MLAPLAGPNLLVADCGRHVRSACTAITAVLKPEPRGWPPRRRRCRFRGLAALLILLATATGAGIVSSCLHHVTLSKRSASRKRGFLSLLRRTPAFSIDPPVGGSRIWSDAWLASSCSPTSTFRGSHSSARRATPGQRPLPSSPTLWRSHFSATSKRTGSLSGGASASSASSSQGDLSLALGYRTRQSASIAPRS